MMGRILQWILEQLEGKIMASIEQLQATLNDTKAAVDELKAATETEKQEVSDKLDALDAKISKQTGLIVSLQEIAQAEGIPDSTLNELAELTASIRTTTTEIRNIVQTP